MTTPILSKGYEGLSIVQDCPNLCLRILRTKNGRKIRTHRTLPYTTYFARGYRRYMRTYCIHMLVFRILVPYVSILL